MDLLRIPQLIAEPAATLAYPELVDPVLMRA
jgi:hypothetical protein